MKLREIEGLIKRFENSNLTVLEYEKEGSRLRIEKQGSDYLSTGRRSDAASTGLRRDAETDLSSNDPQEEGKDQGEGDSSLSGMEQIKSPIVGIFYQSEAPGGKPMVEVVSEVKKGEVLCIIEAMKVMNEIKAPYDLKVHRIDVADGEMVDVGRTLFEVLVC